MILLLLVRLVTDRVRVPEIRFSGIPMYHLKSVEKCAWSRPCTVLCGPSNRFFNSGLKGPFFNPKDQIPIYHFFLEPLGAPN